MRPAIAIRVLRPARAGRVRRARRRRHARCRPSSTSTAAAGWSAISTPTSATPGAICSQARARRGLGGLPARARAPLPGRLRRRRAGDRVGGRAPRPTFGGTDVLVVAGDSAGAQLAASVAIARRDAGRPLAAQLLLYPVTDVAGRYADDEINAGYMSRGSSHKRFGLDARGHGQLRAHLRQRGRLLRLAGLAEARARPRPASPRPSSTPRRWTCCAPRATSSATTCRAAGVDVISREHPSLNHSYFGLGGVSAVADAAAAQAATDLHELLDRRTAQAAVARTLSR